MSLVKNLFNGILAKLIPRPRENRKTPISWLQEKWLKHLPDDGTTRKINLDQKTIYFRNGLDILHTYPEIYSDEIYKFATHKDDPIILDCGAHIGMATLYFKCLFPNAKIHAFEPDKTNFGILERNCKENGITGVQLYNKAIWISDDGVQFEAKASQASTIVDESKTFQTGQTISIATVHLKKLLQGIQEIDFLKIDIEGAEYRVIKDCIPEFNRVKNLFLEYHGKVDETYKLSEILTILKDAGFSVYIKNAADLLDSPFYKKQLKNYPYEVQLNIFCYRL